MTAGKAIKMHATSRNKESFRMGLSRGRELRPVIKL
jgi:hypothetical protein